MAEDKLLLVSGSPVDIADSGDDTCKYATFLISVLDEYDRKDRLIPKEAGEKYHATLRGFPIVAKLYKDRFSRPMDFGGHEMRQWKNRKGETETKFDTYPIGSVIDTWIEDREVAGYEGEKSCIMAKAKLWTCRSPEYFKVLDRLWTENRISSSWELIATDVEEMPLGKKILKAFSFIGNALLGSTSIPAGKGAGIYEYAEVGDEDISEPDELSEALIKDINNFKQEEESLKDEEKVVDAVETPVSDTETKTENDSPVADEAQEAPAEDNADKVEEPEDSDGTTEEIADEGDPEEVPVEDAPADSTDLAAKVAELSKALMQANSLIQNLQSEIETFAPIKADYERIAQEKAEAEKQQQIAELKELALKSKLITEAELEDEGGDDQIKAMISNLDRAGIENLIVTRLCKSLEEKSNTKTTRDVDTASIVTGKKPVLGLSNLQEPQIKNTGSAFVSAYLNS